MHNETERYRGTTHGLLIKNIISQCQVTSSYNHQTFQGIVIFKQ